MHTQLLRLLPLHFVLPQTCNLSLCFLSSFLSSLLACPSLPAPVLAAADIWSGCLVIDWQVMRRLKGRWRQEQVFSTVFLASAKLPCPSLLHLCASLSLFSSFLSPVLFLREDDYAIHQAMTHSDIDCLYMGRNARVEIKTETIIKLCAAGRGKLGLISQREWSSGWDWFGAAVRGDRFRDSSIIKHWPTNVNISRVIIRQLLQNHGFWLYINIKWTEIRNWFWPSGKVFSNAIGLAM